ncbi:hypothetical protein K431DRAFT_282895 [Polychaeton citri CBS 116435]|uniref:Uncharacterized protein n=1 Tax=Polychaeton citri CBS 116435 TaxID=1314669 RepID=A0A9P4US57_9PEZI|nr:hypothetical protein K431DRAFT_282895 [Polychaeton citri CBS 116435]
MVSPLGPPHEAPPTYQETKAETSSRGMTCFFSLPAELREQIYSELLAIPSTVTMHPGHQFYRDEAYAVQPPITRVNRLIRSETLPLFYSSNTISAQLDQTEDLALAKQWLHAIGDSNTRHLRHMSLCGWTKIVFGHMLSSRFVRLDVDLRKGEIVSGKAGCRGWDDGDGELSRRVEHLKAAFRAIIDTRGGVPFDVEGVEALMDGFARLCNAYV